MMKYQIGYNPLLIIATNARLMKMKDSSLYAIIVTLIFAIPIAVDCPQFLRMIGIVKTVLKRWRNRKEGERRERLKGEELEC